GWTIVCAFFAYMALDDGSGLHEALGTAFEEAYRQAPAGASAWLLSVFPSYAWQILFARLLAAGGAFTLWWSWRRMRDARLRRCVVVALACLVLAVGLDFVEGMETLDRLGASAG